MADPRGAFSVQHGATNADVGKFAFFARRSQQESAAAHIASSDEISRELQSVAKAFEQDVAIFRRRDAAEQNRLATFPELACKRAGVASNRLKVARIGPVDIDVPKRAEFVDREPLFRIKQPAIGGDHADHSAGFTRDHVLGVGEFASKVEAAGKREDLPESEALAVKRACERKRRVRVQQQSGTGTGDFCG